MPPPSEHPAAEPSLFKVRAFMRFWYARVAGTMGNQMLMVAVGWQMYDLTGSAWDLGLVGLFQFLPSLLLTLVAGHVADQHDRSRVLALCMAGQVLIGGALAASTARGVVSRDLLLVLSVALGCAKAFQMPAQQALVPLLEQMPPIAAVFASQYGGHGNTLES